MHSMYFENQININILILILILKCRLHCVLTNLENLETSCINININTNINIPTKEESAQIATEREKKRREGIQPTRFLTRNKPNELYY